MIHPDTEVRFINPIVGYGVVATKFIPKGTIVWVFDKFDKEYTPQQLKKMEKPYLDIMDKYSFRNGKGNYVLCWDIARFVNHSFNSSCMSTAYEFEIAIRDIYPGEELTDDYGYLNISEPFEAIPEDSNRTTVYPDDLINFHEEWDQKLIEAFPLVANVDQPLKAFMTNELWEKAINISVGLEPMDSILNCYCGNKQYQLI